MLDELKENFDPEKLFNLYLELDSCRKVSLNLENQGVVNPYTNKRYTNETVGRTIWKWVLDNPEKTLIFFKEKYHINDEEWERFLVEKAYSIYFKIGVTKSRFDNWLRKNDLYDKYKDYGRIYERIRSRNLETIQE